MQSFNVRMSLPADLQAIRAPINSQPSVLYANKKLQNFNCIEEPCEGFGGLYLGDIISLMKKEELKHHKITSILSCMSDFRHPVQIPPNFDHKRIPAKDTEDYPLNLHFEQTYSFIEKARSSGRSVLVHCHAGVSRSAAIVCAYLMKKREWSFNEALCYVKQKRQRVRPNQNFTHLLREYERQTVRQSARSSFNNIFQTPVKKSPLHETSTSMMNFSVSQTDKPRYSFGPHQRPNPELLKTSISNVGQNPSQSMVSQLRLDGSFSERKSLPVYYAPIIETERTERPLRNEKRIEASKFTHLRKKTMGGIFCSLSEIKSPQMIPKNLKMKENDNPQIYQTPLNFDKVETSKPYVQSKRKKVNVSEMNEQKNMSESVRDKVSKMLGRESRIPWERGQKSRNEINIEQRRIHWRKQSETTCWC